MPLIAIHHRSGSFSDRWIEESQKRGLAFRVVDMYAPDPMKQLEGVDGFLWHWAQHEPRDLHFSFPVLMALQSRGVEVFPDLATCWHFDDKLAQSLLLEQVGAPLAPFHIFHSIKQVESWAESAVWPKVFKLRRGSASLNVRLLRNKSEAIAIARKMFGLGMIPVEAPLADLATRLRKQGGLSGVMKLLKRSPQWLRKYTGRRAHIPREQGYFYLQEFLPNNTHDTRVTVIGERAFAFRRAMRKGDFRASGSGELDYDLSKIDLRCVQIALDTAVKLQTQSCAFDFLFNAKGEPRILEISYGYQPGAVDKCSGYWDPALTWHDGHYRPEDLILDDLLERISRKVAQ